MTQIKINSKENAARLICFFLAEEMRQHAISLGEAKEFARAFVRNKNLIDNEEHLLALTVELAKDFPQLKKFERAISTFLKSQTRSQSEKQITEFVAKIMDEDPNLAMAILDDAVESKHNLEMLKQKYPKFADFLNQTL